jgi:diguanylate cyclase (GGDEF)-like protein
MRKIYKIDLLEVYVPIYNKFHDGTQGRVIGAFEIYKDQTALFGLMRQEFTKVPLLLIFAMSALYLFLQVVIRKADQIISEQKGKIGKHNAELREAQDKLSESIDEVIENESFHVRFTNNNLLKCWEHKKCTKKDCPSYESSDLRCWQIAGTFCGGYVQGYFATKFGDCRKCDVFAYALDNRINSIGESFNNMMVLFENKHQQLQLLNDRLNWLIDIDPLTQVGNRRSLQKRVEHVHQLSLRYGRPYSIVMCDVDDFKLYNDLYGHQQGDYALITASNIIEKSLRKTDELFRWGGEEFVIILPEQDIASALRVAEHLRVSMQSLAIEHKASEFHILTMSFGVSSSVTENIKHLSWESVLKEADDLMYRAKSEGRNCVYPKVLSEETGSA